MRNLFRWAIGLSLLNAAGAAAATFSVIATVPAGPQIGAVRNGLLYGTIPASGAGVLFSLKTNGRSFTLLHTFAAGTDGSAPNARLVIDKTGNLFGTTTGGGTNGEGTLWEYSAAGVMSAPHVFGGSGDGGTPMQGPTLGGYDTIYGTASMGANGNSGNIYKLLPDGTYVDLYKFTSSADGHCPFSGVAFASGATLYGTVVGAGYGGNPNGSVWKFTVKHGLETLYIFRDGSDGEWPDQAPALDTVGNLYGTTHVRSGSQFAGAIWKIDTQGRFSVLRDLDGATDGYSANSPLVHGKDGKLYGTTLAGGVNGFGTIYSVTPSGGFSVVHMFANTGDRQSGPRRAWQHLWRHGQRSSIQNRAVAILALVPRLCCMSEHSAG